MIKLGLLLCILLLEVCNAYLLKNVRMQRDKIVSCSTNDDVTSTILYTTSGKERRALRAIANRMKQEATLLTLPCSISHDDNFIRNIKESLNAKELILLRFNDCKNKKEVKSVMDKLSIESNSEIVQIVGHTALIYKEKDNNQSKLRKILNDEIEKTKE